MEKEAVQVENVSSEVLKVVIPSFEAKGLVLKENIEPAVLYGNKELLVVLTGIFLPGILIEGQERKADPIKYLFLLPPPAKRCHLLTEIPHASLCHHIL